MQTINHIVRDGSTTATNLVRAGERAYNRFDGECQGALAVEDFDCSQEHVILADSQVYMW